MRKLKMQMQLSLDGFAARPDGALDWITWDMDDKIKNYINELTDSVDTILMGRKMTEGFISYWSDVLAKPDSPEYDFAKKMIDIPKVVFTKTLDSGNWINTRLAKGDISKEVDRLKKQKGKGIIAYGGASFMSSLVKNNLIDEYHLFINPTAIGKGMQIFNAVDNRLNLKLVKSSAFGCGIVVNKYEPKI